MALTVIAAADSNYSTPSTLQTSRRRALESDGIRLTIDNSHFPQPPLRTREWLEFANANLTGSTASPAPQDGVPTQCQWHGGAGMVVGGRRRGHPVLGPHGPGYPANAPEQS